MSRTVRPLLNDRIYSSFESILAIESPLRFDTLDKINFKGLQRAI
jgi:hypothetical protein